MKRTLFFALIALVTFGLSSCEKSIDKTTTYPSEVLEVKSIFDQAADDLRAPELVFELELIDQAMKGELNERFSCSDFMFLRELQPGGKTYNVNVSFFVGYFLPEYGSTMLPGDPIDMNNDGFLNSADLLTVLGFYGSTFETFSMSEVSLVGGEVSGSGLLAEFSGDLVVEGDTLQPLSLFPGSNSFLNFTDQDEDGSECYNSQRVTFATEIGTVKFTAIN